MHPVSRRKFLTLSGATALSMASIASPLVRSAQAAELRYKVGTDLPASHPLNVRLTQAADAIKKDSNGRFTLEVFANNQLGGDPAMFTQLRAGALEFFTLSGANVLSSLVPRASISGVGFAFKNYDEVFKAMDGELGAYIRGLITKAGLVVQDRIWDNGFRQITTSAKPVARPEDLTEMKIRVPVGELWISLFKALGAAPAALSFSEVYTSLQTKVIDGQENALAVVQASKLYEVQKYCSLSSHMWDGFWLLGNRPAWERIPSDVRPIISRHLNDYALLQRQDVAKLNASLEARLKSEGLAFNAVDVEAFQKKLRDAGYYKAVKEKFGNEQWDLLEKVTGKLV
jgi:tripartite ATP-independent transporter DctP family solute receptor